MFGKLQIEISKDSMKAVASVAKGLSTYENDEITEEYVKEQMKLKGIKAGVIADNISALVSEEIPNKIYVVAEGKYPSSGVDGHYKFFFEETGNDKKPTIRMDGTIDYSVKRELTEEGALLAEYIPAKAGSFGYTVMATTIAPIPVHEGQPLRCKGVEKRDNQYYAATKGEIIYANNELQVIHSLVIDGDCGYGTGDIDFLGDVHIKGDVVSGVRIVADGNITIDGVVEGAFIEASGDIILNKGVHGKDMAHLRAGGSIVANFIDQAQVEAAESIVADSIINSQVYADNAICATGKNGLILGGEARAHQTIEANVVSNEKGIRTDLLLEPLEEENKEECKLIVHDHVFGGAKISISGVFLRPGTFSRGELHLTSRGMQQTEIGKFVPTKKPEKKPVEKKTNKVVLVVDDEPLILKTFYSFLHEKYTVAAVNSAKDAFKFMERVTPDLILLDYMMPEMNGGEMLTAMRAATNKPYYAVPVYFVTAVVDKDIVLKCLSMYPQGYLIKPLGKDEILDAVDSYFDSLKEKNE